MILTRLGGVVDIALLRVDKYIVLRSILQTRVTVAVVLPDSPLVNIFPRLVSTERPIIQVGQVNKEQCSTNNP